MRETIIVTLPYPDSKLSQNHRGAWQSTLRAKQEAFATGFLCAKEAIGANATDLNTEWSIVVEFSPPDRRKRDVHNAFAALKSYIDGIASAMGVDDKKFVEWHIAPFVYNNKSYAKLTFTQYRRGSASRRKSRTACGTTRRPNRSRRRGS